MNLSSKDRVPVVSMENQPLQTLDSLDMFCTLSDNENNGKDNFKSASVHV